MVEYLPHRIISRLNQIMFTNDLVKGLIAYHIEVFKEGSYIVSCYFSNKMCIKKLLRH